MTVISQFYRTHFGKCSASLLIKPGLPVLSSFLYKIKRSGKLK